MFPHAKTPPVIKATIWTLAIISLIAPPLTYFFMHEFKMNGPSFWLALSLPGIAKGFVWQVLTYSLIHSAGYAITFSLLIALFFHMLILWFSGREVVARYGAKNFILFFLSAALFAGLITLLYMWLFSPTVLFASTAPPIYATLTVWALLNPEMQLFFFFVIRMKAKWLVLAFLGITLVFNLIGGNLTPFIADLAGIIWGFLVGTLAWKLKNPYFDMPNTIIDISHKKSESDDTFMEKMLAKIQKYGMHSLTRRERKRMEKISRKRK